MKKVIIPFVVLIVVSIMICFIYFNTDGYQHALAERHIKEQIQKLDKIPRMYIPEGVYSFDTYVVRSKYEKDIFGDEVVKSRKEYTGSGELSLWSDKITIIKDSYKEVFHLADPYIATFGTYSFGSEDNAIIYIFPIVEWSAYKDNFCIFLYDSTENEYSRTLNKKNRTPYLPPSISLNIKEENRSGQVKTNSELSIQSMNATRMSYTSSTAGTGTLIYSEHPLPPLPTTYEPIGLNVIQGLSLFKIIPCTDVSRIDMNHLKYPYESNSKPPKYSYAKYEPKVYDLSLAEVWIRERLQDGRIRNPFIIKSKWTEND
jgi:hypothetical protein